MKELNVLEMDLNEYLETRWNNISPESKKALGLNNVDLDRNEILYFQMMWKADYYYEKCELLEKKLNEIQNKNKDKS